MVPSSTAIVVPGLSARLPLLGDLFAYHFMVNAFLAGTLIALTAAPVGYFLVLRGQSFVGHALSHVGFAGAAAAVLLGISPVLGLLAVGVVGALGIGTLGGSSPRLGIANDIAVGTVLAFSLSLGLFFIRLSSSYAANVYGFLFGTILGISDQSLRLIAVLSAVTLVLIGLVARPLLFASVDPSVAAARGVPVRALSYVFLVLLAVAVAEAVQVVGVLLIFALLVTPAATAQQITARPGRAVALATALALVVTWAGLAVAYYSAYPVGFFVTTFAFGVYLLTRGARSVWMRGRRQPSARRVGAVG